MATQTQPLQGQVTGNVLLYSKPEPLSVEAHGKLGLKQVERPFDFVAKTQAIPVTVTEFALCAAHFPIIFTGGEYQPLAIMSIRPDENLFITPTGFFEFGAYVPAYVRRYPFVLANDARNEQMVVCLERSAAMIQENAEVPLFENGKPSPFTEQVIEFCSNFEMEHQRTDGFVKLLKDLDLFDTKQAVFTPQAADGTQGETQRLAEYFGVSEEKLNALPAEKLVELRDSGALIQIYAHLQSLVNWDKLVARTMLKDGSAPLPAGYA